MKAQQVLELAKRPLNDKVAWAQIVTAIDGVNDLEVLRDIVSGIPIPDISSVVPGQIPKNDVGSLSLPTIMYGSLKMARLFVPTVRAAKTAQALKSIEGLTAEYFDTELPAAVLERYLDKDEDILSRVVSLRNVSQATKLFFGCFRLLLDLSGHGSRLLDTYPLPELE